MELKELKFFLYASLVFLVSGFFLGQYVLIFLGLLCLIVFMMVNESQKGDKPVGIDKFLSEYVFCEGKPKIGTFLFGLIIFFIAYSYNDYLQIEGIYYSPLAEISMLAGACLSIIYLIFVVISFFEKIRKKK
jgi:hypothetical protein